MFECVKTVGLFKFVKCFLILISMCHLGDELERKGCGLIVMCLCVKLTRDQFYVSLTQARVIREKGASAEEMFL